WRGNKLDKKHPIAEFSLQCPVEVVNVVNRDNSREYVSVETDRGATRQILASLGWEIVNKQIQQEGDRGKVGMEYGSVANVANTTELLESLEQESGGSSHEKGPDDLWSVLKVQEKLEWALGKLQ
ncbi:hypothetical protein ADUPG1_005669, partial [Aduncisulcus paluster]